MKTVIIPRSLAGDTHNLSPVVAKELQTLSAAGGGTLSFETGEYHFYETDAEHALFTCCYNTDGEKIMAFPLLGLHDITIDGNGSVFIIHGRLSPFIVSECRGITLCNFTLDNAFPSTVDMHAVEITDDGFVLAVNRDTCPLRVENGHLLFEREGFTLDSSHMKFSLHAADRMAIYYLFAGECDVSRYNLATSFISADAEDRGDTVAFRYRDDTQIRFPYALGEPIILNLDEIRYRSVFLLNESKDVTLRDITIRRGGGGFGLLSQLTENLTVKRLCTDTAFHNERMSMTADAFHIVNSTGLVAIEDCRMSSFLDDAINIHGSYALFDAVENGVIHAHMGHQAHGRLAFIKDGDTVSFIHPQSHDVIAKATVRGMTFVGDDVLQKFTLISDEPLENADIPADALIENSSRMPDVHISGCDFSDYPHIRLSGGGHMVMENNYIHDCNAALLVMDLCRYWYESGRVNELIVRNNRFDNCNKLGGGGGFVEIGIAGFDGASAPKLHDTVCFENNAFSRAPGAIFTGGGVKHFINRGNTLDGKPLPDEKVCVAR